MKTKRIRALVLAAGLGTRLRPLTLFLPKPLLPLGRETVLGETLRQLGAAGCEAAAVNLHHLPERIPSHLGTSHHGLPLVYSHEEEILGTLGALHPLRDFFAPAEAIVVVNGDTTHRWPFARLLRQHLRTDADATLLLHRREPDPALGGGVGIDRDGRVVELRDAREGEPVKRHVFAGVHILHPRLLERVTGEPADLVGDLDIPLMRDGGRIFGVVAGGTWHDLGTPRRYLEAALDSLPGRKLWQRRQSIVSPLAEIHPGAEVTASVIARAAMVGEGAEVIDSVLLPGARVAAGSRLEKSIVGPEAHLPASARIEGRMINRVRTGYTAGPRETIMGDLVYTPLETDRGSQPHQEIKR